METDWIQISLVFNQGLGKQHQQVPSFVKFMNKEGSWEGREADIYKYEIYISNTAKQYCVNYSLCVCLLTLEGILEQDNW